MPESQFDPDLAVLPARRKIKHILSLQIAQGLRQQRGQRKDQTVLVSLRKQSAFQIASARLQIAFRQKLRLPEKAAERTGQPDHRERRGGRFIPQQLMIAEALPEQHIALILNAEKRLPDCRVGRQTVLIRCAVQTVGRIKDP